MALLSNRIDPKANPPTDHIAEKVAAIAMGDPFEEHTRHALRVSPEELKKYTGAYRLITDREAGQIQYIVYEDGQLYFDTGRGSKYEILPESKTTFFIEGKRSIISFEFNEEDEVTQMFIHFGGAGGRQIIFKKEQ